MIIKTIKYELVSAPNKLILISDQCEFCHFTPEQCSHTPQWQCIPGFRWVKTITDHKLLNPSCTGCSYDRMHPGEDCTVDTCARQKDRKTGLSPKIHKMDYVEFVTKNREKLTNKHKTNYCSKCGVACEHHDAQNACPIFQRSL